MKSCLICDDHPIVREAIRGILSFSWPDAQFAEAPDFPTAQLMAEEGFDICLCDLAMPGAEPVEGVAELLRRAPGLQVLIITASADDALMLRLLRMGVSGFVPKSAGGKIIESAIRLVLAGGKYLPQQLLDHVAPEMSVISDSAPRLTDQQRRVIQLVAAGQTNKTIARSLGLAPSTVKTHLDQAMRSLGASNRVMAVTKAREAGLLD